MAYPKKYNWEIWFKQGRVVLTKGKHFKCATSSFIQQARNEASQRKLSLHIQEVGSKVMIEVTNA